MGPFSVANTGEDAARRWPGAGLIGEREEAGEAACPSAGRGDGIADVRVEAGVTFDAKQKLDATFVAT